MNAGPDRDDPPDDVLAASAAGEDDGVEPWEREPVTPDPVPEPVPVPTPAPEPAPRPYVPSSDSGRVPPHDVEAEVGVLGSMMISTEAAAAVRAAGVAPQHFYRGPHADTFRVLCALLDDVGAVDVVLLRERLQAAGILERVGGSAFLSRVMASVPTAANAEHYAKIVLDRALRRELLALADELRDDATDGATEAEWTAERVARHLERIAKPSGAPAVGTTAAVLRTDMEDGRLPRRERFGASPYWRGEVGALAGSTGAGKTGMAWEFASGATAFASYTWVRWPLGQHPDGRPWRVGVVLGENDRSEFAEFLAAHLGLDAWPENLLLYELTGMEDPPDFGTVPGMAWLADRVVSDHLDGVILDNVMSLVGGDHSDAVVARFVMGSLRRLARRTLAAIIVAIHTSKGGAAGDLRRSVEKLFGSAYWGAYCSSVLVLDFEEDSRGKPREDSLRRVLRHAKMRGPAEPTIVVELDPESRRWSERAEPGRAGGDPPRAKATLVDLLRALEPVGSTHPKSEILTTLGISRSTFHAALARWRAALGDQLEEITKDTPHGETSYRLRTLEERAADSPADDANGGRS